MKTIRLYRNPDCRKCARIARLNHSFDWLNKFEDTTEIPATGPLRMGEIAAQDKRSGQTFKGVEAFRLLCHQIPVYWPCLALLHFAPFRRYVERETTGCKDGSCDLP